MECYDYLILGGGPAGRYILNYAGKRGVIGLGRWGNGNIIIRMLP